MIAPMDTATCFANIGTGVAAMYRAMVDGGMAEKVALRVIGEYFRASLGQKAPEPGPVAMFGPPRA